MAYSIREYLYRIFRKIKSRFYHNKEKEYREKLKLNAGEKLILYKVYEEELSAGSLETKGLVCCV